MGNNTRRSQMSASPSQRGDRREQRTMSVIGWGIWRAAGSVSALRRGHGPRASSLGGPIFVTLYSIDRRTMLRMLVSRTGAVGSDRCSPQYAFSERTLLDWNLLWMLLWLRKKNSTVHSPKGAILYGLLVLWSVLGRVIRRCYEFFKQLIHKTRFWIYLLRILL